LRVQAHKISERVHDINLLGMNGETIGKVNVQSIKSVFSLRSDFLKTFTHQILINPEKPLNYTAQHKWTVDTPK